MARLIKRIFLFGLFVVIIVPGLIWLGAHCFTDNSQWARAMEWIDPGALWRSRSVWLLAGYLCRPGHADR
jgi:high-affinity Fe2+/Pb2+ permease